MAPTLAAGAPDTGLSNGELRVLALRRLAVRPGKGRADQATMNRTFVVKGSGGLDIRGRQFLDRRRRRINLLD